MDASRSTWINARASLQKLAYFAKTINLERPFPVEYDIKSSEDGFARKAELSRNR
jgi:hypothetical protein